MENWAYLQEWGKDIGDYRRIRNSLDWRITDSQEAKAKYLRIRALVEVPDSLMQIYHRNVREGIQQVAETLQELLNFPA